MPRVFTFIIERLFELRPNFAVLFRTWSISNRILDQNITPYFPKLGFNYYSVRSWCEYLAPQTKIIEIGN